jgi:hypothetical protein
MKQVVGISRDHSRSMWSIARPAARDYNSSIETIKFEAERNGIPTTVNVVKCGVGMQAIVERETINLDVHRLQPIREDQYVADGYATPLFDSIGDLIELMGNVPNANDPELCFLVMVITDGQENSSKKYTSKDIAQKLATLQATDRWTFVFRVPHGGRAVLERFGVPSGNILEWEQTQRGVEVASQATAVGMTNYYRERSRGVKSTSSFYADLSDLKTTEVKTQLNEIRFGLECLSVPVSKHRTEIREFVIEKTGRYVQGSAFYQLSKTEKVQESKRIIIQDKNTFKYYTGAAARQMLGFPDRGEIRVSPRSLGHYKLFIQSTSTNRKLMGETDLLIYS